MKNRYPWNRLPQPPARPEPSDAEFARAMDRAALRNGMRHQKGLEQSRRFERNHQLRISLEQAAVIEPVKIETGDIGGEI